MILNTFIIILFIKQQLFIILITKLTKLQCFLYMLVQHFKFHVFKANKNIRLFVVIKLFFLLAFRIFVLALMKIMHVTTPLHFFSMRTFLDALIYIDLRSM